MALHQDFRGRPINTGTSDDGCALGAGAVGDERIGGDDLVVGGAGDFPE